MIKPSTKALEENAFPPTESWFVLASRCNITCTDELINRTEPLSSCNQEWLMVGTKKVDYHDKFTDAEKISPLWEKDRNCSETTSTTLFKKESTRRLKAPQRPWSPISWIGLNMPYILLHRAPVYKLESHLWPVHMRPICRLLRDCYVWLCKKKITCVSKTSEHTPRKLNWQSHCVLLPTSLFCTLTDTWVPHRTISFILIRFSLRQNIDLEEDNRC